MQKPVCLCAALLVLAFACLGAPCDDLAAIRSGTSSAIETCSDALRGQVSALRTSATQPSPAQATSINFANRLAARRSLIEIHRAYYEVLKQNGNTPALKRLHEALVEAEKDVNAAEPFGALVDLGFSLTSAGNDTIHMAKDSTFDDKAKGVVRFESKRLTIPRKGKPTPFQLSLDGQFGYSPTLLLLRPHDKNSGTLTNDDLSVLYQDSFVWDLQPRLGAALGAGGSSEISWYGRFGQTILSSDIVAFKRGTDDITLDRVEARSGRSAGVVETGPEFRFFERSQEEGGDDDPSTYLSPKFAASLAYRHDSRFGGLRRVNGFSGAADRFIYRFTINLTKVVSSDAAKDHPFSVKFSVEKEQPLHRDTVPQGTKIIIQSDIDVLKLLNGSGQSSSK